MSKNILIIAAHPDDEALGCGGTILKHKKNGDQVSFLWMTDGVSARTEQTEGSMHVRHAGCQKAIDFIKPHKFIHENFSDNAMDKHPLLAITQAIESFILEVQPDIIYTHFVNDLNIDHCITARAVLTATRPGSATFVKEIYSFEVPSSTDWAVGSEQFRPDTFVDISNFIEEKIEYLKCYKEEMRDYPHTRSIENIMALNQLRGAHMNLKAAEAFMTLRRVK